MKTTTLTRPEPPYRAFLLRCWCDGDPTSRNSWRFVVLEIDQSGRHGFGTLDALVSFLQVRLYGEEIAKEALTRTDSQQKDK